MAAKTEVIDGSDRRAIERAAYLIRSGDVVAFPTETVYGLGADAFDPSAVARVFEVKRRPSFDPLIVHVSDERQLDRLVTSVDKRAAELIGRFWPGPLTLVLPKLDTVPDIVSAGLDTVGVRSPRHSVARALIEAAETPLAAPSANLFGHVSPTTAEHVVEQLGGEIPLILDGGPSEVGVESTVLSLAGDTPLLLRPGGVTREEIEAVVGRVEIPAATSLERASPGRSAVHYAPRTPIRLVDTPGSYSPRAGERIGLLCLQGPAEAARFAAVEVLSATGDLREAAARLFAALRRLDNAGLDVIVAERVPERGLGLAIMDRLTRAANPRR